jgi:serine/threonine protein phosphatase PrpC
LEPLQLQAACATSVGRQRDHNEDSLFMLTSLLHSAQSSLPFGLYIVADGMGGHRYGELASEIAVRILSDHIVQHLYRALLPPKGTLPDTSMQEVMRAGVQEAHRTILKEVAGGGTTVTAALILGEQLTLAHVGDSRAYHLDAAGNLAALTQDHSLVKRLVELGQITAEEAATHPQRNVLYRALGQGEPFSPDIISMPLPTSGKLLLCSDGLWGVLPEATLGEIGQTAPTLAEGCTALIAAANDAGGPDNITVILIKLPG